MIGLIMFGAALVMLFIGFPVAFTFATVSLIFAFFAGIYDVGYTTFFESLKDGGAEAIYLFQLMPYRIESIMTNTLLMAVPMFIFMGVVLQKTKLAEKLLESMALLFGEVRGGIAVSTILVGTLLAASTGVVGASVVAMGVISLPIMLKHKYNIPLACGTICSAGTLGQIIPPSIVLIILGDVFRVPVGDLFKNAFYPGLLLVAAYILFILVAAYFKKDLAPAINTKDLNISKTKLLKRAALDIIPTLSLIIIVLGAIFLGVATPTESSAIGCVGAVVLSIIYRNFSFDTIKEAAKESVKISAMVFAILIGATAFSLVFTYTGGDTVIEHFIISLPGDGITTFVIFTMVVVFVLGFFIDFVEIVYIVVPILVPIAATMNINPVWFGILIALNLQSSFLTPPFGFSLFYLKGVVPDQVKTTQIYNGVWPFILIQMIVLLIVLFYPQIFGMSKLL